MMFTKAKRRIHRFLDAVAKKSPSSRRFWSDFNVTNHHEFQTAEQSLEYFYWRNAQYRGYIDLMPVDGRDGEVVLDYGCGPGHDLVGFSELSKPHRLVGMDISPVSLGEAKQRLALHGIDVDLVQIDESTPTLPLADDSIDYIHSSGVLHHTSDPVRILGEFKRILRPGGEVRVMVYNYNSVYLHLYVAYVLQIVKGRFSNLSVREAFRHSSDSENCPISEAYEAGRFLELAAEAGFHGELLGCAVGNVELLHLPKRFNAIADRRLPREHRDFLSSLTFDQAGLPFYRGTHAGIDACYRLHV